MKELRARHELTQAALAKKVGVRRETIHFVEKGEYNPSLRLAVKIARVFEAPVEDVFLFDDEELKVL
jgi:putative transcriptional regulator